MAIEIFSLQKPRNTYVGEFLRRALRGKEPLPTEQQSPLALLQRAQLLSNPEQARRKAFDLVLQGRNEEAKTLLREVIQQSPEDITITGMLYTDLINLLKRELEQDRATPQEIFDVAYEGIHTLDPVYQELKSNSPAPGEDKSLWLQSLSFLQPRIFDLTKIAECYRPREFIGKPLPGPGLSS